jgi:transcriptional regulator with XRE-family HTH domain
VPAGKIVQAQALLVKGCSQRAIARELRISPMTVAKIIRTEDFQSFLKEQQERVFAIAPIAIESFQAQVATDGYLAFAFLKNIGIIPSPEAIAQFLNTATPQTETGDERQARMIASVLLEGHKNYGLDLGEDFDAAMAKDSQESRAAESSQPKLLRK